MVKRLTSLCNKLAKGGIGVEGYIRSMQGKEGVRLLVRLRTSSARLLEPYLHMCIFSHNWSGILA